MSEVESLRARYRQARQAAEAKEVERDAVALATVPLDHPRHLDRQPADVRARWRRLNEEMWQLRHACTIAWRAYQRAVSPCPD